VAVHLIYYIYTGTSNHWTEKMDCSSGMGNGMDNGMYSWWHHCTVCSRIFPFRSSYVVESPYKIKGSLKEAVGSPPIGTLAEAYIYIV